MGSQLAGFTFSRARSRLETVGEILRTGSPALEGERPQYAALEV